MSQLLPGLVAAVGTTIGLVLTRPILVRYVLDTPNHRSSHVTPTPRGGGLGVWLGVTLSLVVGLSQPQGGGGLLLFGLVITLFAALGLAEDLAGLPVVGRLMGQVMVSGGTAVVVWITSLSHLGRVGLWVAVAIGAAGVFYVNTANFMDGVNGISACHAIVAGTYFGALGYFTSSRTLELCGVAVAVAFAAFLPWNLPRPHLFLGDIGSYLLGASVWLLAVEALVQGIDPVAAIAPLVVYSLDVAATLRRRVIARTNLLAPHREHTYQQIQQLTGSHVKATLVCTAATLVCTGIGWMTQSGLPGIVALLMLGLVGILYLRVPQIIRTSVVSRAAS